MFRRLIIGVLVVTCAVFIVKGLTGGFRFGSSQADYRDPVQLAQAVKDAEHGTAADCSKLSAGMYVCAVGRTGNVMGTYQVTVSADGKSWHAN